MPSVPLTVLIVSGLLYVSDSFRDWLVPHVDNFLSIGAAQMRQEERKTRLEGTQIAIDTCMKVAQINNHRSRMQLERCMSEIEGPPNELLPLE